MALVVMRLLAVVVVLVVQAAMLDLAQGRVAMAAMERHPPSQELL
jgi:hypothetical protein